MSLEITPFESVGILRFGENRHILRHRLGNKYRTFKKNAGENDTDAYDDLGLHLYFDNKDSLEFVEAFGQSSPSFQGIIFLGRDVNDVASDLYAIGHESSNDDIGLQCDSAGIGLTA